MNMPYHYFAGRLPKDPPGLDKRSSETTVKITVPLERQKTMNESLDDTVPSNTKLQVKDYKEMMRLISTYISEAPTRLAGSGSYISSVIKSMIPFSPFCNIFAGFSAFADSRVNERFKEPDSEDTASLAKKSDTFFVVSTPVIGDTYCADRLDNDPNPDVISWSDDFVVNVATRALVFIRADNEKIGLVCFIGLGLEDVSTCQITEGLEGKHVNEGDELGMFRLADAPTA
ncbi:hypothetical protein V8B97DRAFT_1917576 [Scleroderma yunnanense]